MSSAQRWPKAAPSHLEIRTLAERVYEVVQGRLLAGEFTPNEPLRQDTLAAYLGISKIPLREALTRLEQDGLLISQAGRGYMVVAPSAAEAEEVFALRLKLEPDETVRGAKAADAEDHRAAKAALRALDEKAGRAEQGTYNRLFHMSLIRPGAGRITLLTIDRLNMIADRYVRLHLKPEGRTDRAKAEHREILEAWIRCEARRLKQLVKAHIQSTQEDLLKQLTASDGS
jgi:DNA-binding GntR family transcriptional regulator